ncbi:response regulator [Aquincola sp. S2]|uniref:histidine kinase n=1 Tax=Pseudaquabacterium terrae TaxID=2732868 RepID=A0ABX2EMH8_9BURK|nr:HAMP domain-containing sensor histidine kinase [Aquabacterium terrae]NRF69874.1 response regulator [Aquabacterium terrae]
MSGDDTQAAAWRRLIAGLMETVDDFRGLWRRPASLPSPADAPDTMREISSRQFRKMMDEAPAGIVGTILACVLWAAGFQAVGSASYLLWCVLAAAATAALTAVIVGFRRSRPSDDALGRWQQRFQLCIFLLGLVWGSAVLVPAPAWATPYVVMGTLLMVTGSLSQFAAYRPGISLFGVPCQLIPSADLIVSGGPLGVVTGIGFAIAVGLMMRIVRAHNTSITQAMRVAEERRALIDELGVQRREAERANLSKTFFLASVTHDLRQPLHTIALLSDAARARGGADVGTVEQIDASVQSMEALLGALLEISRLDAGAVPLDITAFAVDDMLARVRLQFEPQALAKGLRLQVLAPPLRVRSDHFQLERIVSNLVANAIRYTPAGGVRVRCRRRGATLWLQVWDSGIGIAREDLARVFEEFFQVSRAARTNRQGLGLGLAIVQRAAHRLSHGLRVRSRTGRGSLFEVGVPIAFSAAAEAGSARLAPLLDGRLVLLIDDDPLVLKSMATLLTSYNCMVISAGSIDDAVAAVRESLRLPDLVVSDHDLGDGHTGPQAIARVRAEAQDQIPALLVTAQPQAAQAALAATSDVRVLAKPLHADALAAALGHLPRY